jgi:hypothetical protein
MGLAWAAPLHRLILRMNETVITVEHSSFVSERLDGIDPGRPYGGDEGGA